ncbi:hypothetical protein QWY79_15165 [Halomonas sabkhae]|uniref:hypothetical protein n=1 Tax=Halomonas sabkhae TaxID=626223 RepID=UPI0025B3252B|nr:hypothetical protein [Halomonas sabkhae]MDN3526610.1 hypothetical protein [Halomonas sabkhae]
MSRRCYLHVGMHKTGSSSIQDALMGYEDNNVEYLKLPSSNHSVPLVSAVMPDLQNYPQVKKRNLSEAELEEFKKKAQTNLTKALSASPEKDVVISAEYFSHPGSVPRKNLERLKGVLEKYFSEIKVVAYVRSPESFMESALQQRIKSGESNITLKTLYPHYQDRFQKLYELFGKENISLVGYESEGGVEGSVVYDFCERVGIEYGAAKSATSNEKIGFEAMALLYSYNLFRNFVNPKSFNTEFSREFMAGLQSISASRFNLDASFIAEVLDSNKEDVSWVEDRIEKSFKKPSEPRGYRITCLDDMVSFINSGDGFYDKAKELPDYTKNIVRPELFEAFLENYLHSTFSLDKSGFNSLKNAWTKPVVAFRELAKSLFYSGMVTQSKLVLDLALKEHPGAKALQQLDQQAKSALDDLGGSRFVKNDNAHSDKQNKKPVSKDRSALIRDIGLEFYRKGDLDTALAATQVAYKLKPASRFLRMRVEKIRSELPTDWQSGVKPATKPEASDPPQGQLPIKLLSRDEYARMYEPFREASHSIWLKEKTRFLAERVNLDNIIQRIEKAYQSRTGLSVIRSGDGEGSFLARCASGCERDLFYLCARGSLRLHFGHQNYKYDDLNFWANEIYSAFVSSDIITSARDESTVERLLKAGHDMDFRSMVGQIAGSIVPYLIAQRHGNDVYPSGYLHRDLIPHYRNLLKGKEVVLLGPNDQAFADDFATHYDCSITGVITIPGQYTVEKAKLKKALYPFYYQSALSRLYEMDLRGKVCLVGAGLAGKVFCSRIAQLGGIGLDVGSMMDAWSGKKARKYHTSEFLDASSVQKS